MTHISELHLPLEDLALITTVASTLFPKYWDSLHPLSVSEDQGLIL